MLTKAKVTEAVKTLPDEFSVEELFEKIIVLQKIERGLKDSEEKNTFSTKDAKDKLKKWLK